MSEHVHSHPFRFYRKRGTASAVEFFPHAGTRLTFANRGVDTLLVRSLPPDTLQGGDAVTVTYTPPLEQSEQSNNQNNRTIEQSEQSNNQNNQTITVFRGTVEQITASAEGGPSNAWQDAVVASPWSKMDRLVYQQQWWGYTSQGLVWSSNLVLNQDKNGNSIGFKTQLKEIFDFAADRCGIDYTDLTGGQALPFDEVRDLSCAQAVNRVLRWFPKKTVRFDYSGETPSIELADPSAASWVSGIDKESIVRTYNAHPIKGVYLETVTTGDDSGVAYRAIGYQKYPATADPTAVDTLHATVQLAGASTSASYESAKFHCEANDLVGTPGKAWWIARHGRLAKYLDDQSKVTVVSQSDDREAQCPRIADASVEELTKFGLRAKVTTFTAHVKITDDDEVEENLVLQMKFVMSNAVNGKTYTRQVGGSATSGETIPAGLAQAIYEDRSQALQSLRCVARLGATFPKVGETYEGLILQSFEVDPHGLTAECNFGQPDHLSPDDMAGIMTGFRNRIRSTSCWERKDGKRGGGGGDDLPTPISPMSATEFCPGTKAKTTIKGQATGSSAVTIDSSGSGGNIDLKTSQVESGKTIGVHTLTVNQDDEEVYSGQIMAEDDVTLDLETGGGDLDGEDQEIVTDVSLELDTSSSVPKLVLKKTVKTCKVVEAATHSAEGGNG